jgi:type I restriction-modification system DNA methylase subunit
MIHSGCIQAVIGLPAKLRAESAIETVLVVFGAETLAPHNILFIDAASMQQGGRGRVDLSEETIQTIASLVRTKETRAGVSYFATFNEIAASE